MSLESDAYRKLHELACARFGLSWPETADRRRHFEPVLQRAGVRLESLVARLETDPADKTWDLLIPARTTGETFFLRDEGQIQLLQSRIFPDLLAQASRRQLNLWSAGCSSGEEPYTLAILLARVLGTDLCRWRIKILGTDINPEALARAELGRFHDWSFRGVHDDVKSSFFQRQGKDWLVKPFIRSLVEFRRANLLDPPPGNHFDLILCRNVLIYFAPQAAGRVARQLGRALRPGGFLMVAHGELQNKTPPSLEPVLYPGSVIFRRLTGAPAAAKVSAEVPAPGAYLAVEPPAVPRQALPGQAKPVPLPLLERARQLGDGGRYDEAQELCRQILQASPTDTRALFLAAQLAEMQDQLEASCSLLERILYLDPASAGACLELAGLARRLQQSERADRMEQAGRRILRAMDPEAQVEPYDFTARALLEHMEGV